MRRIMNILGVVCIIAAIDACSSGGSSVGNNSANSHSVLPSAKLQVAARESIASQSTYSYTAPWGGTNPNGIYVDPQGACQHIPATLSAGYNWPAFLKNLPSGTLISIAGTPSYDDDWSRQHNCPTGGIVATNVALAGTRPVPTPTPGNSGGSPVFGHEPPAYDPPASWRPYRSTSTWNQRLTNPDSPILDQNDHSKIDAMFASAFGSNQYQGRVGVPYSAALAAGTGNGGFPFYFAKVSDPLVTINCTAGYGRCVLQGKQFYVPANAGAAQDGDHHLIVIQPDGLELDVWCWGVNFRDGSIQNVPWRTGESINIGWGGVADVANGSGWDDGSNGATAGGNNGLAGTIRQPEIASGEIKHALIASVFCSPTTNPVYPATSSSLQNHCNGVNLSPNQVIATGNRLWLDLNNSQINKLSSFNSAQKIVLRALHDYGAFVTDTNGYDPISVGAIESQMPGYSYGNDAVGSWAASNLPIWYQWNGATWYYVLSADDITNRLREHLHVLAPCVNVGYPGGRC